MLVSYSLGIYTPKRSKYLHFVRNVESPAWRVMLKSCKPFPNSLDDSLAHHIHRHRWMVDSNPSETYPRHFWIIFQSNVLAGWQKLTQILKCNLRKNTNLVTHLKNISQIGSFPLVGLKIKNLWNHHPVKVDSKAPKPWRTTNPSNCHDG